VEDKRKAAALTQRGVDLFFQSRYDEALAALEEATTVDPAASRPWSARALCMAQLGNPRLGMTLAERALELDRNAPMAYTARATCRRRLGDGDGARADFERGMALAPDDYRVYYNYACHWAELGREEECRQMLAMAFDLAPGHFAAVATADPDLARYSRREWFRDLTVALRQRAALGG
jgi:Tfp pilus assembly protein PilF